MLAVPPLPMSEAVEKSGGSTTWRRSTTRSTHRVKFNESRVLSISEEGALEKLSRTKEGRRQRDRGGGVVPTPRRGNRPGGMQRVSMENLKDCLVEALSTQRSTPADPSELETLEEVGDELESPPNPSEDAILAMQKSFVETFPYRLMSGRVPAAHWQSMISRLTAPLATRLISCVLQLVYQCFLNPNPEDVDTLYLNSQMMCDQLMSHSKRDAIFFRPILVLSQRVIVETLLRKQYVQCQACEDALEGIDRFIRSFYGPPLFDDHLALLKLPMRANSAGRVENRRIWHVEPIVSAVRHENSPLVKALFPACQWHKQRAHSSGRDRGGEEAFPRHEMFITETNRASLLCVAHDRVIRTEKPFV